MKEKIDFKTSKGNKLCGILSNPTSQKERPIIILCHGFSTSKDSFTNTRLEKILNENGISTFRFDFFGHGESEGKFEDITVSEAVDDIQNAVKLLKESGYKKIGLVGSSFSGMASLLLASKIDDLYVMALKSPVSDYMGLIIARSNQEEIKAWKEKGLIDITGAHGEKLKLRYSFFEDSKKLSGFKSALQIKIPTLIVHGNRDETVPVEQSIKTASLIKSCRLEMIEGGDHLYSDPKHFEQMLNLISTFIIENSETGDP